MTNAAKSNKPRNPAIKTSDAELESSMEQVLRTQSEGADSELEELLAATANDLHDLGVNLDKVSHQIVDLDLKVGKSEADVKALIERFNAAEARAAEEAKKEAEASKVFTRKNATVAGIGLAIGVAGTFGASYFFGGKDEVQAPVIED